MATGRDRSIVGDLKVDLRRFHDHWMGIVFPRQVDARGTVLGKWQPRTAGERISYGIWSVLGAVVVAVLYPVALFGAVIRFGTRRIAGAAGWLGVLGVVVVSAVAWGALAVAARVRFPLEGFLAVVAAAVVATVSAVGAIAFARIGGRKTTVVVAYPLATTAIFLPPVVAALSSPTLAAVVFPGSQSLAVWLLERIPAALAEPLTDRFDLVGVAYVGMWFGIAVPLGWLLGALVTLADVVRPAE
ncbi:MAG: hypothetical protein V5A23_08020 [Halobacteriales archaeon]